jgi:hypothetical protein
VSENGEEKRKLERRCERRYLCGGDGKAEDRTSYLDDGYQRTLEEESQLKKEKW